MHEQVFTGLVGRDEPEALVVAEPLHGSSRHCISSTVVCCGRGVLLKASTAGAARLCRRTGVRLTTTVPGFRPRPAGRVPNRSPCHTENPASAGRLSGPWRTRTYHG